MISLRGKFSYSNIPKDLLMTASVEVGEWALEDVAAKSGVFAPSGAKIQPQTDKGKN
jgi:hypothetical protein